MGSGRTRWKLSFRRPSSSESVTSSSSPRGSVKSESFSVTPSEFLCPVSNCLMADPVILPNGHTFERACIEACMEISFSPPSVSPPVEFNSSSEVSLIPNVALKAAISNWCDRAGLPQPIPISLDSGREIVKNLLPPDQHVEMKEQKGLSVGTRKGLSSLSLISTSNSSLSSNSQLSSASSSTSSSSYYPPCETPKEESPKEESCNEHNNDPSTPTITIDWLEEEILLKLRDFDASDDQDEVLVHSMVSLLQATRESRERRLSLCTPCLLSALRQILLSQDSLVQTNTSASIANLSIEPENKVPIVRAGIIPPLIEVLKKGSGEARDHTAGALFSLALEEENRAAIGVLGAIPPLIHLFCHRSDGGDRIRRDAGMALYHLSLTGANRSKIAKCTGAVRGILAIVISSNELPAIKKLAMMLVCNLSASNEGRAALLDAGAISYIIGLIQNGFQEEYSVAALYGLSKGSLRFRGLAKGAGAAKVLEKVVENGEGVRKEMARKVLRAVNGDGENGGKAKSFAMEWFERDDEIEEICNESVVSEGMSSFRRRAKDFGSENTS